MNKIEKQRMSLKSRSLVSSDSKRAAKSVSCMRNGKVPLAGSNSGVGPKAPSVVAEQEQEQEPGSPAAGDEHQLLESKASPSSLTMKQEPEDDEGCDDYEYEDAAGLLQQESDSGSTSGTAGSRGTAGPYPMLTRVRSHSRSLRAMANPSAVWAHFDLCSNDPLRAQCRICGAVVVRGGANPRQCGTTNLHRHLRVHHGGRLVGRRYHVMSSFAKQEEQTPASKALRLATQNIVRQMRSIAPAPLPQQQRPKQQQQAQQQQSQNQQSPQPQSQPQTQPQSQTQQPQVQPQQQQQQRTMKTLVLKTIPLKMKHIAPGTIKMPSIRPGVPNAQALPQTILPQQPTEVCLRWNSYHSNMQHSFPSLLDSEQFVDVTLACEGRSLKCHKMILSSCSDYLAQLLRENPCQHPIILMKDLKFWEVEALVKFMYRGEVNVTHDKLPQLLNAAEALQVKGLAGPSNSQNPKPPLLIPQTKVAIPRPIVNRQHEESKENKPSTSTSEASIPSATVPTTSTMSLLKRAQKRRIPATEVPEARPFTKIRLQRPVSPQTQRQGATSPIVKVEPLDIPLSPGDDIIYHALRRDLNDDDDSCSSTAVVEKIVMQEEDDPGGDDIELADQGSDYDNNDDSRNNYTEEHMEFVPTDFLDQEQDIVEDPEDQTNCSTQFTDEDSKQNNEEEDDEEEEDEEAEKSEEESRPSRTKKDKT